MALVKFALAPPTSPLEPPMTDNTHEDVVGLDAWLAENCGRGLPHGEVTDLKGALHALAYVARQINSTSSYKVHIGQCVSATTGIQWVLNHFARAALNTRPDVEADMRERCARVADELSSEYILKAEDPEYAGRRELWLARSWGAAACINRIRSLPLSNEGNSRG
jgi:hypothetical protein